MAGGSIVIDLLMRTGSFETDTKRASKALRDFQREAIESVTRASTALLGLAGAAAGAFLALERGAAAIGQFKDLGTIIGDTGESFASLKSASDVSGVAMNEIADTSVKLTKALSKVDEEGEGAAKALQALGIPLAEFKALSPVQQIDALSEALAGFADDKGATETMEQLVRGGSRLLPLLRELRDQGGPRVIITQDQIDAADKFADSVALLKSQVTQLGQSVLADLLPPFQAFVDEIGEADKALSIFSIAGSAVRTFFETITVLGANVIFVFNGIGNEIGGIAAQLDALARFDFTGFNAISKAMKEDAARARAELDRFEQRILGASETATVNRQQRRVEDRGFDPRKSIDTSGFATGGDKDGAAKNLLGNQVKALEAVIRREQDLLGERNRFLNLFNEQGLVSIRAYYDAQVAIVESATTAQVAAINQQIAATQVARAKATKDSDRADLTGKVEELIVKRTKVEQEATSKSLELSIRREQAEKRFAVQIDTTRASVLELQGNLQAAAEIRFDVQNQELIARAAAEGNEQLKALLATLKEAAVEQAKFAQGADLRQINASVLELQGNLGAAAAIRFDEQNFSLIQRLTAQGNQEALALVQTLRQAAIAQAEFAKASQDANRVLSDLAIQEDRIAISRQLGATTELGALKQIGTARQNAAQTLRGQIDALDAIKNKTPHQVEELERLRLKLEELGATADPLGDKFRSIFEDAGSSGIELFLNDINRGRDALKAFESAITQGLNRIIAQNISESLFGKQGVFGSAVGAIFGGGDAGQGVGVAARTTADTSAAAATTSLASAATAATAGLTPLTPSSTTASTSLALLAAAAETAAAALAAITSQQASSSIGEFIFGSISAFAEGGKPAVGRVAIGGEIGRELFIPTGEAKVAQMFRAPVQLTAASIIGERGPQFFRPNVPGVVIPADETEEILRRFGGFYAGGGMPPIGIASIGGENGRELFLPVTTGRLPPSEDEPDSRSALSVNQVNNFNLQGPVTRQTEQQIATAAGRGLQRAMARNA